jgi:acyl carrier protein
VTAASRSLPEDALRRRVHAVLARHLLHWDAAVPVPLDRPLTDMGLDSLGSINLLLEIEDEFSIVFPDDMLGPATFATAGSMEAAVAMLLAGEKG